MAPGSSTEGPTYYSVFPGCFLFKQNKPEASLLLLVQNNIFQYKWASCCMHILGQKVFLFKKMKCDIENKKQNISLCGSLKNKISYHYPVFNSVNMEMHSMQHMKNVTVASLWMISKSGNSWLSQSMPH